VSRVLTSFPEAFLPTLPPGPCFCFLVFFFFFSPVIDLTSLAAMILSSPLSLFFAFYLYFPFPLACSISPLSSFPSERLQGRKLSPSLPEIMLSRSPSHWPPNFLLTDRNFVPIPFSWFRQHRIRSHVSQRPCFELRTFSFY